MDEDLYAKKIVEASDSYERTIIAMIAFDSAIRWDDANKNYRKGSYFLPGRRLTKINKSDSTQVTPDIVIQITKESGVIAEAKLTASNERDFEKAFEQIKSYDSDLVGWRTDDETIKNHDISLLVDDFKKIHAKKQMEGKKFTKKVSIVACAEIHQNQYFYKIEKVVGNYTDKAIDGKMEYPIAVPLEKIAPRFSVVKYYDAQPPVEYTMNVLWMYVFNELSFKQEKDKQLIHVTAGQATKILHEKYSFGQSDSRQPKMPKEAWIKSALDLFVKLDYAYKNPKNQKEYVIRYSTTRKASLIDVFARKHYRLANRGAKKQPPEQPELFDMPQEEKKKSN